MLVTLLVKFRIKDIKTTELGLLLQVLPVRIITFVETLGSHLNSEFSRIPSVDFFKKFSHFEVLTLPFTCYSLENCVRAIQFNG